MGRATTIDIMRVVIVAAIAVGVLYLTIWPHEIGHSLVAYLYGCKANWWQTDMSWFLWSSWGGAIDYDCLQKHGGAALGLTDFGGVAVNLAFLALAPVVGRWWRWRLLSDASQTPWLFLGSFFWALANYAEAFSYLVLNTLWLKSDMQTVVLESRVSRWVWFLGGSFLAVAVAGLLRKPCGWAATILATPRGSRRVWLGVFVLYVVVIAVVMAEARATLRNPRTISSGTLTEHSCPLPARDHFRKAYGPGSMRGTPLSSTEKLASGS